MDNHLVKIIQLVNQLNMYIDPDADILCNPFIGQITPDQLKRLAEIADQASNMLREAAVDTPKTKFPFIKRSHLPPIITSSVD